MSASLGSLQHLTHLILDDNLLSGTIPSSLTNLTNLVYLNVSANPLLEGDLLGWFASFPSLEVFSASKSSNLSSYTSPVDNKAYMVSPDIGLCQNLRVLEMEHTDTSGDAMPESVGSLSRLEVLKITDVLGFPNITQLTSLKHLRLTFAPLTFASSTISPPYLPADIGGMAGLEVLDLSAYHGSPIPAQVEELLPESIGDLRNLIELDVSFLHLSGPLPSSMSNLTQLRNLIIPSNSFTGTLQPDMWPLLEMLEASFNQFNELASASPSSNGSQNLVSLALSNNNIQGTISDGVFGPSLNLLFLDGNKITSISPNLSIVAPHLQRLQLSANLFTEIPTSLGDFTELTSIILSSNNLSSMGYNNSFFNNVTYTSGNVSEPTSGRHSRVWDIVSKMPQLQLLVVSGCDLSGTIPESIGELSMLQELHANQNSLDGNPFPESSRLGWSTNLHNLDVVSNALSGTLPSWIGEMHALGFLGLSNNQLVGTIPNSIADVPLLHLDLASNHLNGSIPDRLGQSAFITAIDLRDNELSGYLPISFNASSNSTFSPYLSVLDLSYNRLTFCPSEIQILPYYIAVQGTCDFSNQKDAWSRPYDCGCAAGINAFSNCTVSYPLTQCIACVGPPPVENNPGLFECRGGQWVLSGAPQNASLTNTSIVISGSPVVIPGNFSASNITFQGLNSGTLTIGGCASNLTGITIILSQPDIAYLETLPRDQRNKYLLSVLGCNSTTDTVPLTIVAPTTCVQVSASTVSTPSASASTSASAKQGETNFRIIGKLPFIWGTNAANGGGTTLSVLFNLNNSKCNKVKWWVVLIAVLLSVMLLTLAGALTWYLVRRSKQKHRLSAFHKKSTSSRSPVPPKDEEVE